MVRFLFQHRRKGEKSRLWSARVRLDGWSKRRTFPLHVADKRVAEQKLAKLIEELEREAAGIGMPKIQKEAAHTPLAVHLQAYAGELEGLGRAKGTLTKYTQMLPKMFRRCGWKELRDVTPESFILWRKGCGLKPKSMNDNLTCSITFFNWMKRNRLIAINPLEGIPKVSDEFEGRFRRALSPEEIGRLLQVAPVHRAVVYQAILYTGLRRSELSGLKWSDFDFSTDPVRLRVPSSLSKNRKESTHFLRPELAETLRLFRPAHAKPSDFAFRGLVPRVPTFKGDLAAAGIPFEDDRGRRVDIHALRTTFGTMLSANGVSPRVAMELMRHSDMKLTMKVYTDTAQLPLIQEAARLPSFEVSGVEPARRRRKRGHRAVVQDGVLVLKSLSGPVVDLEASSPESENAVAADTHSPAEMVQAEAEILAESVRKENAPEEPDSDAKNDLSDTPISTPRTPIDTPAGVVSGSDQSLEVARRRFGLVAQVVDSVAFGHEKTAGVVSGGFPKMERAKRLELSTFTLAR